MTSTINNVYPYEGVGVISNLVNQLNSPVTAAYYNRALIAFIDKAKKSDLNFQSADDLWEFFLNISIHDPVMDSLKYYLNRNKRVYVSHIDHLLINDPSNPDAYLPKDLSTFFESSHSSQNYTYYSLENFNKSYNNLSQADSLYPIATRSIINENIIVVERSPFKVNGTFKTSGSYRKGREVPYDIWIPWTLTIMDKSTNRTLIYFSSESADSPNAKYIPCILPNIYADASVCFNNSLSEISLSSDDDFRTYFAKVINEYYAGGWNTDLVSSSLIKSPSYSSSLSDKSFAYRNFYHPDYSHYRKIYTPSKFKQLQSKSNTFINSYSGSVLYKYFFEVLSTYNLKYTLDFYNDLINNESSDNVLTYDDVIKIAKNMTISGAARGLFHKINLYAYENSIKSESYSDDFPEVNVFHINAYYPYICAIYELLKDDVNANRIYNLSYEDYHSANVTELPLDNLSSLGFLQKIYTYVFYNFYKNDYSKMNPLYFSYDYKSQTLVEYPDYDSYHQYILDYYKENFKELTNVN